VTNISLLQITYRLVRNCAVSLAI